ncbi:hypothetical protein Tco_0545866 [Tanacetum coccineum]
MELQNDKDLVDYMPKWSSNLLICAMSPRMSASLCCNRALEASALLRMVFNSCSRTQSLHQTHSLTAVIVASGLTTSGGGGNTAGDGDGSGGNGSGGGKGDLDLL